MKRIARVWGTVILAVVAAACSETTREAGPPEFEGRPPAPMIDAFFGSPEAIEKGATATLAWATRNVASLAIADANGVPVPIDGLDFSRGSVTVQPSETTVYTVTASGEDHESGQAWRTVTIHVLPARVPAPVVDSFTASPADIAPGGAVLLSWQTSDASRIAIEGSGDVQVDVSDKDPASGQVTVYPTNTTVYHLTAVGPRGGRATAQVVVTVAGVPRITRFDVVPLAPVRPGGTITLFWETLNTNHIVIRQNDALFLDTATELSGSRTVAIDENARFTIEASGAGGTAEAAALAQVGPDVTQFSASERVVRANDPVTLAWAVTDADRAVIDGPGGYHLAIPTGQLASGSATVNVAEPGDFVLRAFRGDVPRMAAIAIDVTLAPRIRPPLVVDPMQVTASPSHAGTVTLSWTQDGAESCTIFANTTPVVGYTNFPCGQTGLATVRLTGSATLRLVASNDHGSHALTANVQAFPPATIASFASSPARRLSPGDSVELSWEVTDAVSMILEKDGAVIPVGATNFVGSTSDSVLFDSVYVLTAQNPLGFPTSALLTVRAGAPVILSALAEPDFVAIGSAFQLHWLADGGDHLTVDGPDGELVSITDTAQIDNGSAILLAPVEAGEYVYKVTIENGGGIASIDVPLRASDGPMISLLTADPGEITLGQSFTVAWSVTNDAAGNTPTLALVDNFLNDYTTELATKNPNSGSLTITPLEEGRHEYTFSATTGPERMVAVYTFVIEVTVPPFLHTFTATPDLVSTQGGQVVPQVELAWTSENAVEISLWDADEFGNAIPPAFHRISLAADDPQSTLDAGSLIVNPTRTARYVARARNRVGAQAEKLVKVIVDPPEIVSFTATPPEVLEGGSSTLSWSTRNADYVRFEPTIVRRTTEPFVDVSVNPTAAASTLSGDSAVATIQFPAGFKFPFGTGEYTAIQVGSNGTAGFSFTNTSSGGYGTIPNTSRYMNFSIYGGDHNNELNSPAGKVWYDLVSDADGPMFVVQFKNWTWWSSSRRPSDLNFELILRENGNFEFRYGTMTVTPDQKYADGEGASIGFQFPEADSFGMNVVKNGTVVPGGLTNTGWAFDVAQPGNGSAQVDPLSTTVYKLVAVSDDGQDEAETTVIVWKTPAIPSAGVDPVAPMATQPFTIRWTATEATQIRVLDDSGRVLCVETDPALVSNGSCSHVEPTAGQKSYTIEAANGPLGAPLVVTTRTVTAVVVTNLAITTFEVLPGEFVDAGDQLTLNWTSSGAVYMALLACLPGNAVACTDITPAGADPNLGTLSFPATTSTEYWLYIYDQYTREVFASRSVWVGAATVDTFTASATMVGAGTPVTLSWTTTDAESVTLNPAPPAPPPTEVTATAPFIDISSTGHSVALAGSEDSGRYTVLFPPGFTFPWFGVERTGLIATTDGWITFNTSYSGASYSNTALPGTNADLALALLWDDGKAYPTTELLWELRQSPEGRHLIVQWQDTGICCGPTGNLSYQAVLWENGNFDFRYGSMTSTSQGRADGDGATIGFRSPDGSSFHQLSYDTAMSGGLSNRSWRYTVGMPTSGTQVVTPQESTTYRLCATNESLYQACKEVRVIVVKPGDLLFSEVMIAPANPEAEWFELRNLTRDAIDLAGWTLSSGAGEVYTIPATPPLVVPGGGYIVFARSGDPLVNGGLTTPHVYGNVLTLIDASDIIQLNLGPTMIDSVLWGGGWTIPTTGSISLDVSKMAMNPASNDAIANWCSPTATYGNGTFAGTPGATNKGCPGTGAFQYFSLDAFGYEPFIDISATGITVPLDGTEDAGRYLVNFPGGFSFPWFGTARTGLVATTDGWITFNTGYTGTNYSNSALPGSNTDLAMALLWDDGQAHAGTRFLWQLRTSPEGRHLVLQWNDIGFYSSSGGVGDLFYQAILWENGGFDFRYGSMTGPDPARANGNSATIGFRNPAGSVYHQVSFDTAVPGGLSNRSWRYKAVLP